MANIDIESKADWISLAEKTIPRLRTYAAEFGIEFHPEDALILMAAHEYKQLARLFHRLWEELPNSPAIRKPPFFELCALCSEAWALDEPANDN